MPYAHPTTSLKPAFVYSISCARLPAQGQGTVVTMHASGIPLHVHLACIWDHCSRAAACCSPAHNAMRARAAAWLAWPLLPAHPLRCGASSVSVTSATATAPCDASSAPPAPVPAPLRRESTSALASGSSTGRKSAATPAVSAGRSSSRCTAPATFCRLGGAYSSALTSACSSSTREAEQVLQPHYSASE